MVRHRRLPSQTWRTFPANHVKDLVSADFFVLPTVLFRVLFVFVILSHDRRRPVQVAVTEYSTAEWVAHQLLEAFPWDSAPRYFLRDRDGSYGERFREAANWLGIREILTARQAPCPILDKDGHESNRNLNLAEPFYGRSSSRCSFW
jgi:hypothetical protein